MTSRAPAGPTIHPGEILQEEFLTPHHVSRARLARATGLPYGRLRRLSHGQGRITAETALLLGRVFRTTPEFWLALQAHYDLGWAQANISPDRVARARTLGTRLQQEQRRRG